MGRAIVIGAGVIGASVAYHLAIAGMEVEVHERQRPGGGTSGASLAWTNAVDRTPEHYFRLSHLAMAAHRSLQIEVGRTWQYGTGMLEFAEDEPGRQVLEERMERLRAWGYPVQRLSVEQACRVVEPNLTIDAAQVPWVAAFPDDRWVQATVMIGALLTAARAAGATVHPNSAVTGVSRAAGRATGVQLASGEQVDAEVVINCAGPWAAEVGAWFGLDLPMHQRAGLILVTQPAPTEVRGVIRAPGLEIREDGGGRILLNALFAEDRLDGAAAPSIDAPVSREAMARARGLVRGLDGVGFEVSRLGRRPMPDDGRPLVGPVPGLDGAYVVATHSGVSLAPLLGRLVAQEIAHDTIRPELEELRPDRSVAGSD